MIKKERTLPIPIQKLESLLRRLPKDHVKRRVIEAELAKRLSGYRGEQSIDYYLYRLIDSKDFHIINDLRLKSNSTYFQIDVLILSKTHFLNLELKNISGELIFDSKFKQVIRKYYGKEEVLPDPIIQINRQEIFLREQLKNINLPYIPIETLVVMTNPSAILKSIYDTDGYFNKVIRSATLPERIKAFEDTYKREVLTTKDLIRLTDHLVSNHIPGNVDVLSQFQLQTVDLINGVLCPECKDSPMKSIYMKWYCPKCLHISKDAHVQALHDYKLLFNSQISSGQLKTYFLLESDSVCYRWLKKLNFPFTGKFKDRRYQLEKS
ncbi:nuclease-related domain-containing protein [Peribacillus alkalitolerans]|uniref:nuclease-related domain-containing protein n=1 Tax=Peribacillus alkalitolerans TaxID=1550385 RepID=UPI0013D7DF91|nr:nuclease-related domain-containing protein [Peribacillus alkalitolerans]